MELQTLLDCYAERAAMVYFCAMNITLSLRKHRKPAEFSVVDPAKGETHKIAAKSVNHVATWKACLQEKGIDCSSYATVVQRVEAYEDYLLHKPKSPYLFIAGNDDIAKLHDMIVFSAIIRTTELRFAEGQIVDPEVRQRVATFLAQRENTIGMAKAVGHARKHGEDVLEAIDTTYRSALDKTERVIGPIWVEALPALPEGTAHALAWLEAANVG